MTTQPRLIPAEETRVEITVVNSRFIATIAPAFSVEEARAFITRIKTAFRDATHNVPAFIIGHGMSTTEHCHDDGEPSGTAGRPMLSVLRGSGLGDVVVVATRYFGGTKLGKGGLVRAYGGVVREAIKALPIAEKAATHTVMMGIPYNRFEQTRRLIAAHNGQILDEDFTVDVTITARFRVADFPRFQAALNELSRGATQAEIIETDEETIFLI
ncbi:MAG: YigZ family protein [Anaerolineales bacterium]